MFSITLAPILISAICYPHMSGAIECGSSKSMALQTYDCKQNNRIENRIVDGSESSIDELPWMAFVFVEDRVAYCGAAIIHERWLLTAAHCFGTTQRINPGRVSVRIGSTDKLQGKEMRAKNIFINPIYPVDGLIYNDIALIELDSPIDFSTSSSNRVCSPDSNIIDRPEQTVFAGWGQISIDGSQPTNLLKKAIYRTIPRYQCKYRSDYFVCVNATQGMGCVGDSGSPLIRYNGCRGVLMGIFIYAERVAPRERCGPGLMIFVRISEQIKWIESLTGPLTKLGPGLIYPEPLATLGANKEYEGNGTSLEPNVYSILTFILFIVSMIYEKH